MAKLTYTQRKNLPAKTFVFPKTRKYPLPDKSHAVNALSRMASKGSAVKAKVRAAVHRKFPSIGQGVKTSVKGSQRMDTYEGE